MASAFVPEARIEQEEAAKLAQALAAVNAHYATVFNPKIVAWVNLASVGAGIYGPRVLAYGIRKNAEKKAVIKPTHLKPVPNPGPLQQTTPTPMRTDAGSAHVSVVPKPQPIPPELQDPAMVPDSFGE